jgi:nucleotide-binding universal stress UspA family protein
MNDRSEATETSTTRYPTQIKLHPLGTSPITSTAFATEWAMKAMERTAGTAGRSPDDPVIIVVGFDGSEPAQHALDAAAGLLHGREGQLEVVYVGHVPATAALSRRTETSALASADNVEHRLAEEVRARLGSTEPRWHFQPRDGSVAEELLAVADELRSERGPDATIVLVVGGPSRNHHHEVGRSVSLTLADVDRFPLVVVP